MSKRRVYVDKTTLTADLLDQLTDRRSPITGNVAWAAAVATGRYDDLVSAEYKSRCVSVCIAALNKLADVEHRL